MSPDPCVSWARVITSFPALYQLLLDGQWLEAGWKRDHGGGIMLAGAGGSGVVLPIASRAGFAAPRSLSIVGHRLANALQYGIGRKLGRPCPCGSARFGKIWAVSGRGQQTAAPGRTGVGCRRRGCATVHRRFRRLALQAMIWRGAGLGTGFTRNLALTRRLKNVRITAGRGGREHYTPAPRTTSHASVAPAYDVRTVRGAH